MRVPSGRAAISSPMSDSGRPAGRHLAVGTVDDAAARVEQAQEVVDLGDRAHGRARAAPEPLLVDGQRGRQPVDAVDVGLGQLVEELVRVRREALDVAALALGVQGVERQRRLAGAAGTGDDHQLTPRDLQVQVAQVVHAHAPQGDHSPRGSGPGRRGLRADGRRHALSILGCVRVCALFQRTSFRFAGRASQAARSAAVRPAVPSMTTAEIWIGTAGASRPAAGFFSAETILSATSMPVTT
jgi:hypothetical protein